MTTYIKLEDAIEIMQSEINRLHGSSTLEGILEKINSLPSINPESMIEEMIEDLEKQLPTSGLMESTRIMRELKPLKELLQKFKS